MAAHGKVVLSRARAGIDSSTDPPPSRLGAPAVSRADAATPHRTPRLRGGRGAVGPGGVRRSWHPKRRRSPTLRRPSANVGHLSGDCRRGLHLRRPGRSARPCGRDLRRQCGGWGGDLFHPREHRGVELGGRSDRRPGPADPGGHGRGSASLAPSPPRGDGRRRLTAGGIPGADDAQVPDANVESFSCRPAPRSHLRGSGRSAETAEWKGRYCDSPMRAWAPLEPQSRTFPSNAAVTNRRAGQTSLGGASSDMRGRGRGLPKW